MSNIKNFSDLYNKYNFDDEEETQILPLWHYTSVEGLSGIIRPSEKGKLHFWFTRSDCLNDPSEGNYILDLFQQVFKQMLDEKKITKEFYDYVKKIEIPPNQFINYPIPPLEDSYGSSMTVYEPCDSFICSFSLKEDSLDMWRYYSKGSGGYGLKLNTYLFDKYKKYNKSFNYQKDETFSMIKSYRVIYDEKIKEDLLKEIIADTFSVYSSPDYLNTNIIGNIKMLICSVLKFYQFQFKHECYASEQEYRFLYYLPRTKPKDLKNDLPNVKFRSQNGIVVPYLDVTVEDGDSILDEILISPYIENKSVLDTTNTYLAQCGYNCKARKSSLPVRF